MILTTSKYLRKSHSRLDKNLNKSYKSAFFNIIAFVIIMSGVIFMSWGAKEMTLSSETAARQVITLQIYDLFTYSLRTVLRMFIAIIISVIFALPFATLAAKSSKAEQILLPILDVLQSVPILGYISFTVTAFLALFPNNNTGAEMAAIFAIFTSQVWNIIFSFYQSLKSLPEELKDAAKVFEMTSWQKFWRMELPFGLPSLVWNIVLSMSSGWFYVVASEVIVVGGNNITLPGIGSYISLAMAQQNIHAVINAVIAMSIVILLYDQLVLRPLVVWVDKFHYEMTTANIVPRSWIFELFRKSTIVNLVIRSVIEFLANILIYWPQKIITTFTQKKPHSKVSKIARNIQNDAHRIQDYAWYLFLFVSASLTSYYLFSFVRNVIGIQEVLYVIKLGAITLIRVFVMVIIASIIWVPIGIKVGLNNTLTGIVQPIAQFLASFPVNLFFPATVIIIGHYSLDPDIWLSPLIIIGSQWYILFNVIAGVSSLSNDLKEVSKNLNIKGFLLWKKIIIPSIMPHFVTGAITASGAAWNASIVAEYVTFGNTKIVAHGLGSYIAETTIAADFHKIALGVGVMALYVILFNKFFWQPLSDYINKKFKL
ncbi:MAG: ABC transporter permease [Janthinobacterium lividum]